MFFFSRMPFGKLGAFFLTFRDPIFAPREHLGKLFWHLGTAKGTHFGISGAHWDAIFAPRDPGRPWEQQDGHEVARHRMLVDFGVISGRAYVSFYGSKSLKCVFNLALISKSFFVAF